MKALSLTQPWASLMAIEAKRNETRSRPWYFKGDVAICSTRERWRDAVPDYADTALIWLWRLRGQFRGQYATIQELYNSLPFGCVVCVVEKYGCVSTNDDNGDDRILTKQEIDLGGYDAGRFYYPTRHCRRLTKPVPVIGKQGFFDLPPEVESAVKNQLAALRSQA